MFKIGDSVVYGQNGVMTVTDIRHEEVLGKDREYYVLHAVGTGEKSFIFVPCDSENLTGQMRHLMTKDEISALLNEVKTAPALIWTEDSRIRSTVFKKIFDSGDYKELIRMIFAIEKRLSERADIGNRSYLSDEAVLRKAKRLVYSEISAVLGLSDEETEKYIKRVLSGEEVC